MLNLFKLRWMNHQTVISIYKYSIDCITLILLNTENQHWYITCITATWIDTPSTSVCCFLLLPSREVNSLVSLVSQRPILIVTSYQLLRLSFMESPEQNQSIWTWCPFSPKLSSYLFQQSIIIEAPLTVPAVFEHWDIVEWAGSFRPGELRYIRFSIRFPATATFLLRLAQWQAEEYNREVHNTPLK